MLTMLDSACDLRSCPACLRLRSQFRLTMSQAPDPARFGRDLLHLGGVHGYLDPNSIQKKGTWGSFSEAFGSFVCTLTLVAYGRMIFGALV